MPPPGQHRTNHTAGARCQFDCSNKRTEIKSPSPHRYNIPIFLAATKTRFIFFFFPFRRLLETRLSSLASSLYKKRSQNFGRFCHIESHKSRRGQHVPESSLSLNCGHSCFLLLRAKAIQVLGRSKMDCAWQVTMWYLEPKWLR